LLVDQRVWREVGGDSPFSVLYGLNEGDLIDFCSKNWKALPVDIQMFYSKKYQEWYATQLGIPVVHDCPLTSDVGIQLVFIPPGIYRMGPHKEEICEYWIPKKILTVQIKKPFLCGKFKITQAVWYSVMGNSIGEAVDEDRPKINLESDDVQLFCIKTNLELLTSKQWEYACRAGTTTVFPFPLPNGDDSIYTELSKYANYGRSPTGGPDNVGRHLPNAWGMYDMLGNGREYTKDIHVLAHSPNVRIVRGSDWAYYVNASSPASVTLGGSPRIGFRVCKNIKF